MKILPKSISNFRHNENITVEVFSTEKCLSKSIGKTLLQRITYGNQVFLSSSVLARWITKLLINLPSVFQTEKSCLKLSNIISAEKKSVGKTIQLWTFDRLPTEVTFFFLVVYYVQMNIKTNDHSDFQTEKKLSKINNYISRIYQVLINWL